MAGEHPPDPGPRPVDFEFPFSAASRVVATIEDLVARYRGVARAHEDAAAYACVGFEGRTAQIFDAELGAVLAECARIVAELQAQQAQVEGVMGDAGRQARQRTADVESWERRRREHVNATR